MNENARGMTPTTVYGWPSTRTSRADDLRVAAERALPQRVAEDDFALVADFAFLVL